MIWFIVFSIIAAFPGTSAAGTTTPGKPNPQLFVASDRCLACHNGLITPKGQDVSIGTNWQSSMMAHAAKDPYWQASVRREALDHPAAAAKIEDECSACHMPMTRYQAKINGRSGTVFGRLPLRLARNQMDRLAAEGVSCAMCHQISQEKLGTEASFTAGFVVDTDTPLGRRPVYGPYKVDRGRIRIMQSASLFFPETSSHLRESAFCGTCHTLFTHALGEGGEIIGRLPEQVPYLEWRHSDYYNRQSCQSCHMPELSEDMHITRVQGLPRQNFSRHVFRGGNFLMPLIFNQNREELAISSLPQDLVRAARETKKQLAANSARLSIRKADLADKHLRIRVELTNMTGHKLPTAYPSRRAWIHLEVEDTNGNTVFESGTLRPDGSIRGNDNDLDPSAYEPHYRRIESHDQVQIYEAIMADRDDKVTTGLLSAVRFIKDNRLLPRGFDKYSASDDIAVRGAAGADDDFTGSGDLISYELPVERTGSPFTVRVKLWYQPIAFRWAHNLEQQQAAEIDRFVHFYRNQSEQSAMVMAEDSRVAR